jgi:hypothetical protein
MKLSIFSAIVICLAMPGWANCPSSPPFSPSGLAAGDQRVNAAWLEQNLAGKRLVFDDGTEVYNADGSYSYRAGNQSWDAPSYVFYENGVRCIGYGTPRFDYYVVNNGQLVLVNAQGQRFVGRLTN